MTLQVAGKREASLRQPSRPSLKLRLDFETPRADQRLLGRPQKVTESREASRNRGAILATGARVAVTRSRVCQQNVTSISRLLTRIDDFGDGRKVTATRYRLVSKHCVSCEESEHTPIFRTCIEAKIATLRRRNAQKTDRNKTTGSGNHRFI